METKDDAVRFLTAGQVAKRLDVNISTIGRWVKSGRLNGAELPSGGYVIPIRDVERVEAERSLGGDDLTE
ncbi:MAG: helix-turn-helix domain-containing protein [Actinomycetes bacterium]